MPQASLAVKWAEKPGLLGHPHRRGPLVIALGVIARKPGVVVEDRIEVREYLGVTVLFDHDVVDGVPAVRFVERLQELVETGYGLEECGH